MGRHIFVHTVQNVLYQLDNVQDIQTDARLSLRE